MEVLTQENSLVLMNYKEPLRSVEDGFGYYGAILVSQNKDFIQCHICGELHRSLGRHILTKHNMRVPEYKKMYGLSYDTALVGETTRRKLAETAIYFMQNLSEEEKKRRKEKRDAAIKKFNEERGEWKVSLEVKNKYGTCPDQTLA